MRKFISMLAIASIALGGFTACSSDDDDDKSLADIVEGKYEVVVDTGGLLQDDEGKVILIPAQVIITKKTDKTVDLKLEGFNLSEQLTIPISLNDVELSGKEGDVRISSSIQVVTVSIVPDTPGLPIEVKILNSSKIASKSDFIFDISVKGDVAGMENGITIKAMPKERNK